MVDQGGRENSEAKNSLGTCCYDGPGVEQNLTKAVEWYTKAAEKGNLDAMYNLGLCFHHGQGVEKNLARALEWYTKSRDAGDADAQDCIDAVNALLAGRV